jgi:4-amino-4-deoxy-L-arabinose transferase-like glycosyltransferase
VSVPKAAWLVGAVGLLAFTLRVVGLQYGLPEVYNPDEVAIMARALSFAKGSLNPHNFLYPTFYFYVLFAWVGAYLAFLLVTGRVGSVGELQQLYFTDPAGLYTAGRLLGAVAGTASVLLVYRLARRLADRRAGFAAMIFLALAPVAVVDAHYVKHDVPATLAIVVAYLAMIRVWPAAPPAGPGTRDVLLAGAACGMAFSTHYYCVFLALPLAWVVFQAGRHRGWRHVVRQTATAAGASAVVFFALSPFLLVEPITAWRDITANREIVIDRAVAAGAFAPAVSYLKMLWFDAMGIPVVVLALIGSAWMIVAAPGKAVLLLSFVVPFFLFISNTHPSSRYLNPLLPLLAVAAGWALSQAVHRLRLAPWVFWIAVAGCALPPAITSARAGQFFRQTDTRTLALEFVEREIPSGATVLVQPYSVPLKPSREGLVEALTANLGSPDAATIKFQLQLAQDPYPNPAYRVIYLGRGGLDAEKIYVDPAALTGAAPLEPLRRLGVAFVILKGFNGPDSELTPLRAALARDGRRIAVFSPYREGEAAQVEPFLHNTDARIDAALARPGPALEIWRLHEPRSPRDPKGPTMQSVPGARPPDPLLESAES